MNRTYRSMWNEVSRTFVAVAEKVRAKGKSVSSGAALDASEAALLAGGVMPREVHKAQAPPAARKPAFSRVIRPLALEQRFMFDGAAVATVTDAAVDHPVNDANAVEIAVPTALTAELSRYFEKAVEVANAPAEAATEGERQELIVVDWTVEDYKTLIAGIDPNTPVIVLQPGESGLAGLAKALEGYDNLDAIHLVTHGWGGALQLGRQLVTDDTLAAQSDDVLAIADALKSGGDLMLYGCSVANGEAGQDFVNDLTVMLGDVDVAASTDKTGPTALQGDWDLEWRSGDIETVLPFTLQGMQDISHCLGCTISTDTVTVEYNQGGAGHYFITGNVILKGDGTRFASDNTTTPYSAALKFISNNYNGGFGRFHGGNYYEIGLEINHGDFYTLAAFSLAYPTECGASNTAPTFIGSATLSVSENASAADIKTLLHVSDSDSGQTLTWSQNVATNHGGTLTISSATASSGSTNVTPDGTLTYAPAANYVGTETFTIKVADSASTPGSATRQITVTINDVDPTITASQTFSVNENSTVGTAVGTVAKTGDTNGLIWSITGGTGQSLFDINASTGAITVKSGAVLDYETTNSYTLTVAVDDEDVDTLVDSTATITVNLNNVAENTAPTISDVTNQTTNEGTATSAISVTLGDAETAVASLTLAGTSSNTTLIPNGNIVFGGSGANRTVTITPAANQTGTATITLTVTDGNSATVTDTFTVTVNDVNPAISNATHSVDENSTVGTAVGTVTATGDTNGLSYSITGGTGSSLFEINSSTGAITVKSGASLDYEATNSYSLTVAVDDEDVDSTADSTATITVNLNNVDEIPVVGGFDVNDDGTFSIGTYEYVDFSDSGAGFAFVTDPDLPSGGSLIGGYLQISIASGTQDGRYKLDETTYDANTGLVTGTESVLAGSASNALKTDGSFATGDKIFYLRGDGNGGTEILEMGSVVTDGSNGTDLKINFSTTDATAGLSTIDAGTVGYLARFIKYTTDTTGSRTFDIVVNDGTGTSAVANATLEAVDNTAPTLSSATPADNATGIAPSANITLTFDEAVAFGTAGTIELYNVSSGATVQTWDVSNAAHKGSSNGQAAISGNTLTLNPTTNLSEATQYAIRLSTTAIKDTNGNAYAGIADNTTLNFTTGVSDSAVPVVQSINRTAAENTNAGTLTYTVKFNEAVTAADANDFEVSTTGNASGTITGVTGSGTDTLTVTVGSVTGTGKLGLNLKAGQNITDLAGNALATSEPTDDEAYNVDRTLPTLVSINRSTSDAGVTHASSLQFIAVFSEPVSGLDASDFVLSGTASSGSSITSVSGNGTPVITITVGSISGNGTLSLALAGSPTITDTLGNSLSNTSPTSTVAESYTIDTTAPTAVSILRNSAELTTASSVTFDVVFSETVENVTADDFQLTGTASGNIASVTGSGSAYTVTVNSVAGDGTLGLSYASGQNIVDAGGNAFAGTTPSRNETFAVDNTNPSVSAINRAGVNQIAASTATNAVFTVVFSEPVSGLATSDFTVTGNASNGGISSVSSADGKVFQVTVASVNGTVGQTIGINFTGSVSDRLSQASSATFTSGQSYTIGGVLLNEGQIDQAALDTLIGVNRDGLQQLVDAAGTATEVIIVDSRVPGLVDSLTSNPRAGADVWLLDAGSSAIEQINRILAQYSGLTAIHLLSHGSEGAIYLGAETISNSTLTAQASTLAGWGNALSETGDFLIYGCDVAKGDAGMAFVNAFATATAADVAASDDLTGASWLGGDWELELVSGNISALPIDNIGLGYQSVLAASRVLDGGSPIFVRPGGTSFTWTYGTGTMPGQSGTYAITSIDYHNADFAPTGVGPEDWILTRGKFQYSTNSGGNWTDYAYPTTGNTNFVTTAGKIWRFVDNLPGDTTTSNPVGNAWIMNNAFPGQVVGGGATVGPDNAPTNIASDKTYFLSDTTQGTAVATLTPTDTGYTTDGYWVIDSQSTANLFTISSTPTTGNTATLSLGTGAMPAIGQTATVTVRYYDLYQTDSSGNPINGQGFSKQFTYTVIDSQSNDLNFGNDLNVSTTAANDQISPAVTTLSNGNFVAVWQSAGQGGESVSNNGIYGQIYDATGTAVGSEFAITAAGNSINEITPVVSALNNGRFVVAYATTPGANGQDIAYRIVEANGTVGGQLIANTSVANDQYTPSVTTLTDGSFVIAWVDYSSDFSAAQIRTQKFDASNGAKNGSETAFTSSGLNISPSVAALSNGAYVVAWGDGSAYNVNAAVSTSPSTAIAVTADAAAYSADTFMPLPRVAGLSGGGFVVAWDSYAADLVNYAQTDIFFRRYDNTGSAQGAIVQANNTTAAGTYRFEATVDGMSDGGFVVGWQSDTGDYDLNGIFARRFSATGVAVDASDFEINKYRRGDQNSPAITALASNMFATVWVDNTSDTTSAGIEARVLLPSNNTPTISDVSNQTTNEGTATSAIAVTVGDTETAVASLTLSGASSNTTLIPNGSIVFGGSGANRTVTITPAANQTGTATITLTVTDGGSATTTDTFTVTVNDVNPVISNATLSVNENAANSTTVGTVSATGDTNGLTYSITGGNTGSVFAINSSTGEITVNGSLNYEGTPSYSLTVAVDDEDVDSTADSTATITVNLNNLNEAPTDLALGATSFNNTQAAGATLTTITGTDPDSSAPNNTLTYTLVSGTGDTHNARFDVSSGSLKVASGSALGAGTYNLRLRATDAGTGSLTYEEAFSVTVTDAVPTLSSASPADNTTGVAITSNMVLTFSETIAAGTGNIVLYDITGAGADTRTIAVGDSSQVTISGSTLTINPTANLLTTNQYAVKMASGVILDGSAQAYAGIADNTTLNFTTGTTDTVAPVVTIVDVANPASTNAGTVTINFSEQVQNLDISDFTLTRDGNSVDISGLTVAGSGAQYTLNLSTVTTTAGTYVLSLATSNITDSSANALAAGVSETFVIDKTAPSGVGILRASANPMTAGTASFTVAFSEAVSGVTAGDFTLSGTATGGASVGTVTRISDSVYTVTVTGVTGNGTLGLDLNSSGTGIADLAGNAISGGATGQLFTVDNTAPSVTAINRNGAALINGNSASFTVSFDSAVNGIDASDFSLDASGVTTTNGASDISVSGSGSTYTVTVANLNGAGTVSVDLKASGTGITDMAGNAIASGFTPGDTLTRETTAPTITSSQSFNLPENMTAGFAVGQVRASDTNGVASYAITSGNTDGFFAIDADGVITLTSAGAANGAASRDYETAPNLFTLGVTATDALGNVSSATNVTINLLDAVENAAAPALTGPTISLADTAASDTLGNQSGTLSATDVDGIASYGITGATTGGSTVISSVTYDLSKAGTYGTLYVVSTGTDKGKYVYVPTSSAINALSSNASDTFTVSATDSNASPLTGTGTLTVNITAANDTPTLTAGTATATLVEAGGVANATTGTAASSITLTKGDVDGTASFDSSYLVSNGWTTADSGITYSKTGTYGSATLTIATGVVSYALNDSDSDTQGLTTTQMNDSFTIQVTDGTATQTVNAVFAINGANDAPVITSGATGSVAENAATSTVIYTAVATDVDAGQTRTYSLSGTDAALLDINSSTGAVSLKASANFETKASYSFNVIATDNGTGSLTATQAVTVNVTDVNENPVITSGASATAIEKLPATTLIYQTTATDVDAGQSQTYSISGGSDQAKFQINSTTGALTFVNSPKFNQPVDADGNNVYQLEISASDGQGGTDVRQLAVTVVSDIDGDGLPDTNDDDIDNDGKLNSIEDPVLNALGTGTGDGNGDGIQDRSQLNVVSLPTIATSGGAARYATLVVPEQYTLSNVSNSAAPSTMGRSIRPAIGQFDFSVGGVTPGGSVTLSLYVEKSLNMNSFYKQDASGKWVNIATGVSTVGSKTKIDFSITDGGIFDADRTVNGVIVDPGVPAQMLPLIQSNGGDVTAVLNVNENQTAVTKVSASAFGNVVYSISGGADRARFLIDPQTGVLTFVAPENFEAAADAGADNRYEVLVSATDANGTDTQSVTVVLQNVNESPTGTFKVSGRPEVGTTLTVEDTLVDPDGARQDAVFTWRDSDGNILGTGTSLLLKQAQVGKQINVTLTYRDPSGETETHRAQLSGIVISLPVTQPQTNEPVAPSNNTPLVSPVTQPSVQPIVDTGAAFLQPNSPLNSGTQPGQSSLLSNPGAPNPVPNSTPLLPRSNGQGGPGGNDAPIFTRSNEGGFQVQVVQPRSGVDGLSLAVQPNDLVVEAGGRVQIQLSSQTFVHTNPNATVQLFASMANGSALPAWMKFNPSSGQFDMTPPPGLRGVLEVRVVARDQFGKQALTTMKITVGVDASRAVQPPIRPGANARDVIEVEPINFGRANLSEQLKMASRPLGSSERLAALSKAVQVANQRRV